MICAARGPERGTAVVLAPALMLVLVALGAIAVDLSVVHSAHRTVHRVASTAADDAAAQLDDDALHLRGELRIDPVEAERVATARTGASRLPGRLAAPVEVSVDPGGEMVEVHVTVVVPRVVGRGIPGTSDTTLEVVGRARMDP